MNYTTEKLKYHGAQIQQWIIDGQPALQFRHEFSTDNWQEVCDPPLWCKTIEYRYKPATVWVNTYNNNGREFYGEPHTSSAKAKAAAADCPPNILVSEAIKYEAVQ